MAEESQPKFHHVRSLLQGVEVFGKEKRWTDIKYRFFSDEEDLTPDKLKETWKIFGKNSKEIIPQKRG